MPSMGLICRVCELPMQKVRTSKPQGEAAHNACRSRVGGVRSHGRSGYRYGCRCDVCREAQVAAVAAYEKRRKVEDGIGANGQYRRRARGVDPLISVDCVLCSKPLLNVRSSQAERPMHKACRSSAPEWVRRGAPSPKVAAFRRKIERAAAGMTGGKRVFVNGACAWCAGSFTAVAGVYCSDKCKVSARFSRRSSGKSFTVSPRARAAIYERDSWVCQLCEYSVDASLDHRHNWAASLDHIIPQSKMLIPDHSPSNLRLVHRMCNSLRGDGSNVTEIEFRRRIDAYFEGVAA